MEEETPMATPMLSCYRNITVWVLTILCGSAILACTATSMVKVDQPRKIVMTEIELQSEIMGFADRFATFMLQALEDFQMHQPPPDQRRIVLSDTVLTIASVYTIAAEPNPDIALLDMVAMVTLGRIIYEEHWRAQIGSDIEPIIHGLKKAENDVWHLAARILDVEMQGDLRGIILEWRRSHPEVLSFSLLRFNDFAAERQKSTIAQARQVNGLFQSVQQATQEVEEARLLAERTLFLATRMPLMAGYFADVWLSQMTVNPQAQNLIANLDRMTDVAERMATVAEKFPQDVGEVRENLIRQAAEEMNRLSQINIERIAEKVAVERETAIRQFMSDLGKERHKAIQDLVSEEERINRMLADLRQSLEESTRFMAALNLFMEHLAPLVAEEKLAEDPFDINEYAQTATNIGNAAQELNTLAITFKEVLDAPGWQIVLPRIEAAINRAGTEGEELIDHTFKQTALLILLFLVGYVLARLFLDNLKRKQKRS
jgi:hypothetical protein